LHSSTTVWIWEVVEVGTEPAGLVEEDVDLAVVGVELPVWVVEEEDEPLPQPASRAKQERASSIGWRRRNICRRVAYFG
jgi:hypothetical protein